MATLLDERLDDEEQPDETEQAGDFENDPVEQETQSEIPDKYRGKSAEDLVRMHQEAEKLLGRQSSEVGELRQVVDSYIQTQLSNQQAPQQQETVDGWIFSRIQKRPLNGPLITIQRSEKLRTSVSSTKRPLPCLNFRKIIPICKTF